MAENNAPPAEKVVPLTEPPKEGEAEGEKGPSKGALKKMQKEKEKVWIHSKESTEDGRAMCGQTLTGDIGREGCGT